jgi:hypothetical protein
VLQDKGSGNDDGVHGDRERQVVKLAECLTTTTKLIANASRDEPFASFSAWKLDHACGEKSSTVVISNVTAKAKIASKKVTALPNSRPSRW